MTVKLYPNEVVLKAGDTNQVVENIKVDGKLIVTNQRIYFKTIDENKDRFNLEILFENILEVIFFGSGFFSSKGLNVVTKDGRNFSFPLKKRDEIGMLINRMY
jgi:ribonucleotide reductase beta subunit family protein with ferritin-like domain